MRILSLFVANLLAFVSLSAGPVIRPIRGPVYLFEDLHFYKANGVFHVGESSVVVVSACWTPAAAAQLEDAVRAITPKPIRFVVNTNFHPDRAGGNPHFRREGARIIASRETREQMIRHWDEGVAQTRKAFPALPDLPLCLPDLTFARELPLHGGRVRLLYPGPAHTEGNTVAWFPQERVLYAGCMLKRGLGNLADANTIEYPKTLARLKTLPIEIVVAGHGSPLHGPDLIDEFLGLLAPGGRPEHRRSRRP